MKKNTHPKYQEVLFIDTSTGYKFICGTTLQPKERETYEGKEYPAYRLSISSASHPFFVGGKQYVDTEGRIEKFTKKYQNKKIKEQKSKEKALQKTAEKKSEKKETSKKRVVKKKTPVKQVKKVKVKEIEGKNKKTS